MTIIIEGGDRVGKSTVCKKLKEIGFKYHHFDYPKSNDVVKIYDDYLDNLKDQSNYIYDRALFSEFAYSRYYNRQSNMTESEIIRLQNRFKELDKDNKVVVLYLENSITENLKLLKIEGENKINTFDDIINLRSFYMKALKLSIFPVVVYNYEIQKIEDIFKMIGIN